jgi:hypothetical protein
MLRDDGARTIRPALCSQQSVAILSATPRPLPHALEIDQFVRESRLAARPQTPSLMVSRNYQ